MAPLFLSSLTWLIIVTGVSAILVLLMVPVLLPFAALALIPAVKFILFWRTLKLNPPSVSPYLLIPALTIPLYPVFLFFFKTMFRMPAPPPEASYFAEGLVITSTLSIALAG